MKKSLYILIGTLAFWSCATDEVYEDLNRDPKNPTEVSAPFLFTAATASLVDQMASPSVNTNIFRFFAQYLTTTTYLDEPNYGLTNRNIPQSHWSELYRDVIFDLQNAKENVSSDANSNESEKNAKLAQIEVLEVYAWHVLVDSFGDIPYTQALQPTEITLPEYDDDAVIYEDLINRLNAIDGNFNGTGFTTADVIYNGDLSLWRKFANSLKLRLAMRIADVNPGLSQSTAESAVQNGVFASNEESALLVYQSSPPNTNPLWEDLVQSGRSDYLVANTLVDYMNPLDDPRRSYYFDDNLDGEYVGGIYGASNSYPSFTHIGEAFLDPTLPGILLDYAEVEFYLAEAAARNYAVPGTAEEHYNAAITASILYSGATAEEAAAYIAQPEVAYDAANWRESIGFQFWIAMFDNSFEGWSVWRKFNTPVLNVAADSELPVPLRYTYPVNEQNLNTGNYDAASSAIGGDAQQTPIFWDVE